MMDGVTSSLRAIAKRLSVSDLAEGNLSNCHKIASSFLLAMTFILGF